MQSPVIFMSEYPQLPNWASMLLPNDIAILSDFDFRPDEILLPSMELDEIYTPHSIGEQRMSIGREGKQTEHIVHHSGDVILRAAGDEPLHLIWPDGNAGNSLYLDPALYITVGRDFLSENVRGIELRTDYKQHNPPLAKHLQKLYSVARKDDPLATEACLYSLVRNILSSQAGHHVSRLPAMEQPSQALFQQVRTLVNEYLDSKITLVFLAETLDISLTRLTMQFRRTAGISVHDYVLQVRLRKAQQLLLKSNHSLSDIAYEVGFSSQAHLTTAYRRYYGVTPSEFRRDRNWEVKQFIFL